MTTETAQFCKSGPPVEYPGILFGGGFQTNSDEERENGDLGAKPPSQGFWRQL